MTNYDFIIVGAGIVGLAIATRLQEKNPQLKIAIVEKENGVAAHQSGHNSGVIHAGVYYEPGSLKARLCRAGLVQTIAFCRRHEIAFSQRGKLIVATNKREALRLDQLYARAQRNGVKCHPLDQHGLAEREPNVNGIAALHVVETGIVDYAEICRKMVAVLSAGGAVFRLNSQVIKINEESSCARLETTTGAISGKHLIVCAGLQADRLAKLAGLSVDFAIIPFRGDFFRLSANRAGIVKHLIYPVPDPSLPFLGVHLTPTIDGGMTVGPSAMLALHREAYKKYAVSVSDLRDMAGYRGLWRLLMRYPQAGAREFVYAVSRRAYLGAVQKYCPALELSDLGDHQCGVRAQAVSPEGYLIHDFLIQRTARMTHVCNAPSPAATASLPIADFVIDGLEM
jgi:L-2-hydroxyglutarate oxidase